MLISDLGIFVGSCIVSGLLTSGLVALIRSGL